MLIFAIWEGKEGKLWTWPHFLISFRHSPPYEPQVHVSHREPALTLMAYQTSATGPAGIPETLHACFPGQTTQKFFYSSDIDYPVKIKVYVPINSIPNLIFFVIDTLIVYSGIFKV